MQQTWQGTTRFLVWGLHDLSFGDYTFSRFEGSRDYTISRFWQLPLSFAATTPIIRTLTISIRIIRVRIFCRLMIRLRTICARIVRVLLFLGLMISARTFRALIIRSLFAYGIL